MREHLLKKIIEGPTITKGKGEQGQLCSFGDTILPK